MEELQEEYLVKFPNRTFVTYKEMRIFYEFKSQYGEWFVIVRRTGEYSSLGSNWTSSKEEAIKWGIAEIDEFLATHTLTKRGWLPNFILKDKK